MHYYITPVNKPLIVTRHDVTAICLLSMQARHADPQTGKTCQDGTGRCLYPDNGTP